MQINDFSLAALYAALDAQRCERGLSWAQATREITRQPQGSRSTGMAVSTVERIGTRRAAEGDGVLQMLRWLDRSPESFVPDYEDGEGVSAPLPKVRANEVLRFDTKKLYAVLDARRAELGLSWALVAKEIGLSAASLTYLAKGTRTGFPHVMRITRWLGRPAAEFTRVCNK